MKVINKIIKIIAGPTLNSPSSTVADCAKALPEIVNIKISIYIKFFTMPPDLFNQFLGFFNDFMFFVQFVYGNCINNT